ncbi:MAG: phosphatase PAP2 family protein [Candidatus Shapirobacteria bacterium]
MFKKIFFWTPSRSCLGFCFRFWHFFSFYFFLAVIFLLNLWWVASNNYPQLFCFWKIMLFSEAIHQAGKFFSPWPRPYLKSGAKVPKSIFGYSKGSFPSGHALRAVIIFYFLAQINVSIAWILAPGLFLSVFSRLVFSLHYPVDIVGGFSIGLLLINFC